MKKTLFLVIILSVVIGTGIFLVDQILFRKSTPLIQSALTFSNFTKKPTPSPSPTPKPTLPPLTENSNLEEELNILAPSDYQEDFKNLKNSL